MRVGVDVQVVAEGNRSGLYTCLRAIVREIRPLVDEQLTLFAERRGAARRLRAADLSGIMDGAPAELLPYGSLMKRLYLRSSRWQSMDVLLHNLHGGLPRQRRAANAYLVPDV